MWMILAFARAAEPAPPPASGAPSARSEARVEIREIGAEGLGAELFSASGRVRLVNFWATWCPPCRAELPILADWARAHPEVELVFVDLDLPKLRATHVEPFVREQRLGGFRHFLLADPDPIGALARLVPSWPDQVPVTLEIGPDGSIRRRWDRAVTREDLDRP